MSRPITPKSANQRHLSSVGRATSTISVSVRSNVPTNTNQEVQQRSPASTKESSTVAAQNTEAPKYGGPNKGPPSKEQSPKASAGGVKPPKQVPGSKGTTPGRGRAKADEPKGRGRGQVSGGGAEVSDSLPTSGSKSGASEQPASEDDLRSESTEAMEQFEEPDSREASLESSKSQEMSLEGLKSHGASLSMLASNEVDSETEDSTTGGGQDLEGTRHQEDAQLESEGKEETKGVKVPCDEEVHGGTSPQEVGMVECEKAVGSKDAPLTGVNIEVGGGPTELKDGPTGLKDRPTEDDLHSESTEAKEQFEGPDSREASLESSKSQEMCLEGLKSQGIDPERLKTHEAQNTEAPKHGGPNKRPPSKGQPPKANAGGVKPPKPVPGSKGTTLTAAGCGRTKADESKGRPRGKGTGGAEVSSLFPMSSSKSGASEQEVHGGTSPQEVGMVECEKAVGSKDAPLAEVGGGATHLKDGLTDLKDGPTHLKDRPTGLKDGPTDLKDGPTDLKDGPTDLKDGPTDLKDRPTELKDGPTELKDGPTIHHDGAYTSLGDASNPDVFKVTHSSVSGSWDLSELQSSVTTRTGEEAGDLDSKDELARRMIRTGEEALLNSSQEVPVSQKGHEMTDAWKAELDKELAEVRREKERVVASKDEEIAQLQLQSKELVTHLDELQSTCEQTVEEKKVELASKGDELARIRQQLEEELQTKNQQVKQYKKQVDSYKAELEKCQAALQQNKVLLEGREKELEGCRRSQNEYKKQVDYHKDELQKCQEELRRSQMDLKQLNEKWIREKLLEAKVSENERMVQPQATVQSSSSRPKTEYAMAHNMASAAMSHDGRTQGYQAHTHTAHRSPMLPDQSVPPPTPSNQLVSSRTIQGAQPPPQAQYSNADRLQYESRDYPHKPHGDTFNDYGYNQGPQSLPTHSSTLPQQYGGGYIYDDQSSLRPYQRLPPQQSPRVQQSDIEAGYDADGRDYALNQPSLQLRQERPVGPYPPNNYYSKSEWIPPQPRDEGIRSQQLKQQQLSQGARFPHLSHQYPEGPPQGMLGHPIAASESAGVRQPRPPQSYEAGESSVGMPYDPNLTCTYCGERFRVGEIQSFRRHVTAHGGGRGRNE